MSQQPLKFDVDKFDLFSLFDDIIDVDLPDYFENKVIPFDDEEDLWKWDDLSQESIAIGRKYGFRRAYQHLLNENSVNHIFFSGRPYVGKTTAGLSLAVQLSKEYGQVFDERNCLGGRAVVLTIELTKAQFPHIEDFDQSIIFLDEMQHAFHRKRAISTANVEANKFFDSVRKLGVNTISTAPNIKSIDADIADDKLHWKIHCYGRVKGQRLVKANIYFNACDKSGTEWDWIFVQNVLFRWVNSKLYWAVTKKISKDKMYSVDGLDNFADEQRRIEYDARERQKNEIVDKVMQQPISLERKAYQLFKSGQFSISDIEGIVGLTNRKVKRVQGLIRAGVPEKEIKMHLKKGRAKDSST
ncbi:MAG: hypothetical protein ACFFC7_24695 [Candidatus Hermodarchaeota archaeon]